MTRRSLLGGLGATAVAPVVPCLAPPPPHPVGPVNQEVAARHGIAYTAMPRQAVGVDVEALIGIRSAADIAVERKRLVDYVWKGAGLPRRPPRVDRGVRPPAPLTQAAHVDMLTVPLKYGVSARVFHAFPRSRWNRRLAVYHNGHGEPADTMVRTVEALLGHGYSVLICAMPFMHWNGRTIADPRDPAKKTELTGHDPLARWESAGFSALTFFLEPIAVALNHAIGAYRPTSVQMVGLSGGGWTTTVYAALDPRVTRSYPVAGSLPFYLRPASELVVSSTGDWEQRRDTLPGFYGKGDYLDLYVMAAAGPHRRQVQILNRFDSCCFSGVGHRSYGPVVGQRAQVIGGSWEIVEDATHDQHTISPYALSVILHDLMTRRD